MPMYPTLFLLALLLMLTSPCFAGSIDLVRPDIPSAAARGAPEAALETYEARKGGITLNVPALLREAPIAAGDAFNVAFFPDAAYTVIARSVVRQPDGTLTITGRVQGHDLDTFVLTMSQDGFLITLQDLDQGLVFRATGQGHDHPAGRSGEAAGTVTEIEIHKLPPAVGLPPLLPPEE